MASMINDKNQQEQLVAKAASPAGGGGGGGGDPKKSSLPGVSSHTASMVDHYAQGYKPGSSVQAAQDYLAGIVNGKPTQSADLTRLYDEVMNYGPFSYNLNGDALYQQYKDRYQSMGKQAMMDTMGNASALTGGYGSSYAATAGNQAYQQYLQQLNNVVPELYQMAYDRYNQDKTDLTNRYNLAYGNYRDSVTDWENERDYASNEYWKQYDAEYADYQNMLNYWTQMAQQESTNYYNDREYAYNLAMQMIQRGTMPSTEILAMAGISVTDAKNLARRYGYGASSKSSSRSGKSSSSGGTKKPTKPGDSSDSGGNWWDGIAGAVSSFLNFIK